MTIRRVGLVWLALLGALWFSAQARAEERPAPGTFLPRDPTQAPYAPPPVKKRAPAKRPPQNDSGLRLYLLLGGSVSGRAQYSPPNGDLHGPWKQGLGLPRRVRPSNDLRVGITVPVKRWLGIDIAGTHTGVQTRYFERHGRQRSHVVNLRVGPMFRLHTGTRRGSPIVFATLSAGPSWAFIASDATYVKVRERTSAKTSVVVHTGWGMEIPLVPDAFGLRFQLSYEWLRADYAARRETEEENLGTDDLKVRVGRTVGLIGFWGQL